MESSGAYLKVANVNFIESKESCKQTHISFSDGVPSKIPLLAQNLLGLKNQNKILLNFLSVF